MWPFTRAADQLQEAIETVDEILAPGEYQWLVSPHIHEEEVPDVSIDFDIDEIQNDEIKAMNAIVACFDELDGEAIHRVIRWVADRYVTEKDVGALCASIASLKMAGDHSRNTVPMTDTRP